MSNQPKTEFMSFEDATYMVKSMSDVSVTNLEGVDVFSGTLKGVGSVTCIIPCAGKSCLIYPLSTRI